MATPDDTTGAAAARKPIRPLDAAERRVLGVLIEKAKTTPDQYPLSLSGLVAGCNQKSNRDPVMTLDEEGVTRALSSLRQCGAVAEVFGNGRLARYRHLAYEWLGAAREELAILGELLLRGEQTEGDLRGRASRMDPIADLDALRTHLDRLADRGLVVWLSPPGRGRMLTHGLLPPEKLEKVRAGLGLTGQQPAAIAPRHAPPTDETDTDDEADDSDPGDDDDDAAAESSHPARPAADRAALVRRIEALEAEVAALRGRLDRLEGLV
jgi:uncharacterized protein YceH (UPF0502 family)